MLVANHLVTRRAVSQHRDPPIIVLWSFQPSHVQLVPLLQSQHRDHPIFTHKRLLSALLLYRVVSSLSHLLHLPFKCRILSFFELLFAIRCFTFSPIRFYSSSSAPFFQHRDVMWWPYTSFPVRVSGSQQVPAHAACALETRFEASTQVTGDSRAPVPVTLFTPVCVTPSSVTPRDPLSVISCRATLL